MAPTRVILMSCGSYNPPTIMHLRMFEIARDHLHRMGTHVVVGGVISPVHDAYAKKELTSASHRCAMLRLALQNNDWIRLSTWETRQNGWTRTRLSLQHHQNLLNAVLFDSNDVKHHIQIEDMDWIPENIKNTSDNTPIQIKLLCGADLLESFGTCDLWAEEDIDAIVGQHGLVVITREGSNPNKFIYDSDILSKHMHNIYIVTEWIPNEVSSTRIRRALKRGESVKYLLQDPVIDYIYKNGIFNATAAGTTIKLELTSPNANNYLTINPKYQSTFLTPSPSDVTMESPSPVEIISIDVPDTVLRKNMQNATSAAFVAASRHSSLEEAREKFINAIVTENSNGKLLASAKAAYPGQAKQIIATESGESQILDEVGFADDERKVARVRSRTDDVSFSNDLEKAETSDNSKLESSTAESSVVTVELGEDAKTPEDQTRIFSTSKLVAQASLDIDNEARYACALSDFTLDKEDDFSAKQIRPCDNKEEEEEEEERIIGTKSLAQADLVEPVADQQESTTETDIEKAEAVEDGKNNSIVENLRVNDIQEVDTQTFSSDVHQEEPPKVVERMEEDVCTADNKIIVKRVSEEEIVSDPIEQSALKSVEKLTIKGSHDILKEDQSINESSDKKSTQSEEYLVDKRSVRRDVNLEIDGKYLKSVVNSRKSPRRSKGSQMRFSVSGDDIQKIPDESSTTEDDAFLARKPSKTSSVPELKNTKTESRYSRGNVKKTSKDTTPNELEKEEHKGNASVRHSASLKDSLDSVESASETRTVPRRKVKTSKDGFSKKSKSYESIKKMQEVFVEEPTKTDSSSQQLFTANVLDAQTDEFCSVCCYVNEVALRTEEEVSSINQETFYTIQSNCSSLMDEDSTECDICSSWNLQESSEAMDRKLLAITNDGEPFCEVCEICGEVGTAFVPNQEPMLAISHKASDFTNSQLLALNPPPSESVLAVNSTVTNPSLDDDRFEIENCGFQSGTESIGDRNQVTVDQEFVKDIGKEPSRPFFLRGTSFVADKSRERYFVPKDEVGILSSSSRRMSRKGSLLRKKPEDPPGGTQDKRRYSSADNLQLAKVFTRSNDKFLRSKGTKLIGSADNIRTSRSSRRCKSLQRSADNVRYLDSSTDNLDSLIENAGKEDELEESADWDGKQKVRDNETVKMILTKHGIKIISEKETAL